VEPLRQYAHDRVVVADPADVGAVRRAVKRHAERLHGTSGPAELVATELATNLLRHAVPGGWVLTRPVPPHSVEILAVDRGPGIPDVEAAVAGHTVEPKGLGCGLAAVRRAAERFDVHTERDRGTCVLALVDVGRHGSTPRAPERPPRRWAGTSVSISEACGDGWAVAEFGGCLAVAVIDGLGHGIAASMAADAALRTFALDPIDLDAYVARAHQATRATRGAAATVCVIDPDAGRLRYVAVGNVNGRVASSAGVRGLTTANGTLGLQAAPPRAPVRTLDWSSDATLVVWSDGLSSRVELDGRSELLTHDPAVAAAVLHRDHTRDRDDATVVVIRSKAS
jgi:anti-sigma regulatory factor (Ser/Thr protein kinase)